MPHSIYPQPVPSAYPPPPRPTRVGAAEEIPTGRINLVAGGLTALLLLGFAMSRPPRSPEDRRGTRGFY